MNKIKYISISLCLLMSMTIWSQSFKKGVVSGVVVDGTTGEAVPYVTIAIKSSNGEIVGGQISDDQGNFVIENVSSGSWIVELQFLGYETLQKEIRVSKEVPRVEMGEIAILEAVQDLGTVEVTVERSTIQQKIDRKVITIGKDLATAGPSASDLMVNIPSVDVDQDGNVSLRGNDNVMILVDGKPTNLSSPQLLQQIPSGSIKEIELITNPSAKYVPEGMSGIINIVLKKNTNLGFNGTATGGLTAGHERRWNGSVNSNLKTGKANYFLNYGVTDGPSPTWGLINRPDEPSDEDWFAFNDRTSHLVKFGMDYDLSDATVLSAYSAHNIFDNAAFRSTDILFGEQGSEDFGQEYASKTDNYSNAYNFDVRHEFNAVSKVEFEIDYNWFDGSEQANFQFYGSAFPVAEAAERITSIRDNTTVNVDYELAVGTNMKVELGGEARIQRTTNGYETTNPNFNGGVFDFDRNIYAAYFNIRNSVGKWTYQLGARLEDFQADGQLVQAESEPTSFKDQIYSIYPSLFFSYTPDQKSQRDIFNLSLSRRVDRPNLDQINPMRAWSSARITNVGNPSLVPQFTHSVEFNYTRQLKEGSITTGVFGRRIFDEITRFGFIDPENQSNILFSYNNYQDNTAYGFELSGNYQIMPWWSFTSSFDLYSQLQRGVAQDEFREVRNTLYNFRMNHSFKANKKLTFQLIGLYRGGNTNLQYRTLAFYFVNAGVRYSMFKGKGTLSVNLNDIFHTQQFSFEGERPLLQTGVFDWDSQTFFIGYSHRFGSGKKQSAKRKKRDTNEKKNSPGL